MFDSFNIALSGLNANEAAINTTGDNLANLNTVGFKSNSVDFLNMVSTSLGQASTNNGMGVSQLDMRQFTQGTIETATAPLSAAIQGDGFFVINDGGATEYTRAGNFTMDQNGTLVTATGQQVQGWMATNGTVSPTAALGNITISPNQVLPPSPTTQFSADINLDASAVAGQSSGTFSTPIQVVDSLGVTHNLTITFTRPTGSTSSTANTWDYAITAPAGDFSTAPSGPIAKGTLTFDTAGNLKSPSSTTNNGQIAVNLAGLADGAADLKMQWNLYNTDGSSKITQFASASSASAPTQDGNTAATLSGVQIVNGGQVMATYSNGTQRAVAQLAVAGISNPDSLVSVGANNFAATSNTATPAIGMPGSGGRGQVMGESLETSNVDLATEFTNLIQYERSYQADSKVITTTDDMTQSTVNLIQQ